MEDLERYVLRQCEADAGVTRVGIELEWLTRPAGDPAAPTPLRSVERIAATARPLPAGGGVTFEPGGQLELSTRPFADLDAMATAARADTGALRHAAAAHGIELVACGVDPLRPPRRVLDTPRYRAMEAYFDTAGGHGRTMMCTTAALQLNVGLGPADQWATRWRVAHAIGPVLVAAFANSPEANGRAAGQRSARMANWLAMDPTRCHAADAADDPVRAWTDYAATAEVMMIRHGDDDFLPPAERGSFAAWMRDGREGEYPTIDDFAYHLTTLFPPVRLKGWLELRMIDALPSPYWEVAAAVAYSALVDIPANDVLDAVAGTESAWAEAAEHGLTQPALATAARRLFALVISTAPASFRDAVADYAARFVNRGRCPADDRLDARREPAWI